MSLELPALDKITDRILTYSPNKLIRQSKKLKKLNGLYVANCIEFMNAMPSDCVDLVVTSPPYDNLRDYKGYEFEFEAVAQGLFKVLKPG